MSEPTPTWTCEWCAKVHFSGEDYLKHQKVCQSNPYHDTPRVREWTGDMEELAMELERTLAAQRTALQWCYEKLQPMQPFEEWVKEIGK